MNVSLNGPCATNLDAIVSELSAMGWMPYSSGLPEDSYINDVSYGQILLYGDKVAVSSLYPHLTVLVQADHAPASGDTPDIASFEESFFDLATVPSNPPQAARAIAEAAGALEEECRRGTVFRFRGYYFFLSNMYPLDEGLTVDGMTFESSESPTKRSRPSTRRSGSSSQRWAERKRRGTCTNMDSSLGPTGDTS